MNNGKNAGAPNAKGKDSYKLQMWFDWTEGLQNGKYCMKYKILCRDKENEEYQPLDPVGQTGTGCYIFKLDEKAKFEVALVSCNNQNATNPALNADLTLTFSKENSSANDHAPLSLDDVPHNSRDVKKDKFAIPAMSQASQSWSVDIHNPAKPWKIKKRTESEEDADNTYAVTVKMAAVDGSTTREYEFDPTIIIKKRK